MAINIDSKSQPVDLKFDSPFKILKKRIKMNIPINNARKLVEPTNPIKAQVPECFLQNVLSVAGNPTHEISRLFESK